MYSSKNTVSIPSRGDRLSRGGIYAMAWGTGHPDKTLAIDLDNGFVDPKSWPGRKVQGPPSPEWTHFLRAYGLKSEEDVDAYKDFPADHMEAMAKAKVPILVVYGDADKVVPHKEKLRDDFRPLQSTGWPRRTDREAGRRPPPARLSDPKRSSSSSKGHGRTKNEVPNPAPR